MQVVGRWEGERPKAERQKGGEEAYDWVTGMFDGARKAGGATRDHLCRFIAMKVRRRERRRRRRQGWGVRERVGGRAGGGVAPVLALHTHCVCQTNQRWAAWAAWTFGSAEVDQPPRTSAA